MAVANSVLYSYNTKKAFWEMIFKSPQPKLSVDQEVGLSPTRGRSHLSSTGEWGELADLLSHRGWAKISRHISKSPRCAPHGRVHSFPFILFHPQGPKCFIQWFRFQAENKTLCHPLDMLGRKLLRIHICTAVGTLRIFGNAHSTAHSFTHSFIPSANKF